MERQAQCKVALIRHFAPVTPTSDLTRPGHDVVANVLELRLRLFHGELLVSARLLKHLPTCRDAPKCSAWRHGFDIGIEQRFRGLEIMRRDSLDELACTGKLHRRNLAATNTIFKRTSIAKEDVHGASQRSQIEGFAAHVYDTARRHPRRDV